MKISLTFKHWREPLHPCSGHREAYQGCGKPWPRWQLFALGELIPLHHHNPYGQGVLAWRLWLYTRRGGRLIDLTFDDRKVKA